MLRGEDDEIVAQLLLSLPIMYKRELTEQARHIMKKCADIGALVELNAAAAVVASLGRDNVSLRDAEARLSAISARLMSGEWVNQPGNRPVWLK